MINKIKPIHPFAARMAPEIAFDALNGIKKGATILDPMAGSGTVLRTISEQGYKGLGIDIDPLSVLMSKAWTYPFNSKIFNHKYENILSQAKKLYLSEIELPWIDEDCKTKEFINFWFGRKQINGLRKLSYLINEERGPHSNIVKIALSRLIIRKSTGASLAADVSHSRPHKVRDKSDFDIIKEFEMTCKRLEKIINSQKPKGKVSVDLGDARRMRNVENASIASIITSPPYLNALDYMRGHKLALVWLGFRIEELGKIRSNSVGTERGLDKSESKEVINEITKGLGFVNQLPESKIKMINRYSLDMYSIVKECKRVLESKGKATFVVGNSCLTGVFIENSAIVAKAGKIAGLKLKKSKEREIPESRRYLPPPTATERSSLKNRMRTEVVLTFEKL